MNEHPNTPDEMDAEAAEHVGAAYRRLPAAEPSATLDARIRAAVAAELAQGASGSEPAADQPAAEVIQFPWWRRASAPLALAASLVVALGLGQWWFLEGGALHAPGASEQLPPAEPAAAVEAQKEVAAAPAVAGLAAPVSESADRARAVAAEPKAAAEAPVLAARKPATEPSAAEARADAAPPKKATPSSLADAQSESAVDARREMKATAEQQGATATPPAEPRAATAALREEAAANQARAEEAQPRVAAARARKAEAEPSAAPAPPLAAAPAPAPAAVSAPAPGAFAADVVSEQARAEKAGREDPALRHVRELLAQGKTLEARTALERWRKAHPEASVPEDLRPLLTPGTAASAPD